MTTTFWKVMENNNTFGVLACLHSPQWSISVRKAIHKNENFIFHVSMSQGGFCRMNPEKASVKLKYKDYSSNR